MGKIGEFPVQALWGIGLTIALWFIMNRHRFGEHVLFIGDNANVARVVGVNVDRERVKLFTLMGPLAGFAAVLLTPETDFFNTQGGAISDRAGVGLRRHVDSATRQPSSARSSVRSSSR